MIFYIIIFTALVILATLEFLRRKYKIDDITKKSRELINKYNETRDEKVLMEVVNMQKAFFQYFLLTSIIVTVPIFYVISLAHPNFEQIDNTTIKLPDIYKNHKFAVYYDKEFLGFYTSNENSLVILDREISKENLKFELVIIKLPFKLPLFNKDWLSTFGSYLLIYMLLSLAFSVAKRIYKLIYKTRT